MTPTSSGTPSKGTFSSTPAGGVPMSAASPGSGNFSGNADVNASVDITLPIGLSSNKPISGAKGPAGTGAFSNIVADGHKENSRG